MVRFTLYAESKKAGVIFRTAVLDRADAISLRSLRAAANNEKKLSCKMCSYVPLMRLAFQDRHLCTELCNGHH